MYVLPTSTRQGMHWQADQANLQERLYEHKLLKSTGVCPLGSIRQPDGAAKHHARTQCFPCIALLDDLAGRCKLRKL